ncbi:MAG TPA: pseudouridine-5'-phosphate glycosidase [Trueperaceae bacterium]|nr:pseudouridine-5'-phosphate glycosidase [Trueperaceae bacterium]
MSLRIAQPVLHALSTGRAVVALESTVVTHGLPRPRNLALARRLEAAVREAGAMPATVGVLDGVVEVGLTDDAIVRLAEDDHADKASLWNLPALAARRANAGTTVAATLYAAARAGIRVFATGGIGGVHDRPFDESADLPALARYPVLTVCSGPKSILDAAGTLERLETYGVSVVGYRSDRLAGFVVPLTDLPLPARVDTPAEAAAVLDARRDLGMDGAVVLSNPVSEGVSPQRFEAWLDEARRGLAAEGVRGRDTTPYLLARLAEVSGGATLEANLRLLEENARLAAAVARDLTEGAASGALGVAAGGAR